MKAAVLTSLNSPLDIADVEPCALDFGQVLVRVLCSGICGAQLQEIRGEKGGPLPHLMGHEGAGVVEQVGPAVTRVRPGDMVCMHWRKAAGVESPLPAYRYNGQTIASGRVTTFSEYSVCSENRLTPVPAGTDPELVALLGCSLSTALGTIERDAAMRWGDSVLVVGCGGLGMSLLATVGLGNPGRVCACDIHERKRGQVHPDADRFYNLINDSVNEQFDLILDTAGAPETMEQLLPQLAPSGRYVMIGQPAPGKPVCVRSARHMFDGSGKTISATQGGGFRPDEDIPRYLRLVDSIYYGRLVTHRFPLDRINTALDLVRQGEAGRVLLEIGKA